MKHWFRLLIKTAFICVLVSQVRFIYNGIDANLIQWFDIDNDIRQVVTRNGYHFENHTVVTEDGYILQIHRLNAQNFQANASTPVVFFMHGSFQSSMGWLMAGVQHSLPFRLADSGYDVWMGNARGNRYSRCHLKLDPDRQPKEFFDFSWHEMGYYDMPASVDHIRLATGVGRIHVVTHSQGSAAAYVMLSERPEYNQKIRSSVALAPGVYITYGFQPTAGYLGLAPKFFEWLLDTFKLYELFPYSHLVSMTAQTICHDDSFFQPVCSFVLGITCGFNYEDLNTTLLPTVFTYGPCGASWKQIMHYAQVKNTDRFQKFDEGVTKNMEKYGQEQPLEYNLTNVQIPTALFYSDNDWAIDERDFIKLYNTLPNVDYLHKEIGYAHMDFLIAKSNIRILDKIEKYLSTH